MKTRIALAFAAALVLMPAAYAKKNEDDKKEKFLVVVALHKSDGTDAGTATFTENTRKSKKGVHVHIDAKNLPVGDHAVHIHQNPKCDAPDFKTAGAHFNPDGKKHGMNNPAGHHNGDMPGNLTIGETHTGSADFTVDYISLDPAAPNSIVANGGTSLMIHDHADDMMTDPTGNAGNRIACGVITQIQP